MNNNKVNPSKLFLEILEEFYQQKPVENPIFQNTNLLPHPPKEEKKNYVPTIQLKKQEDVAPQPPTPTPTLIVLIVNAEGDPIEVYSVQKIK